jgi:hypothetical protein
VALLLGVRQSLSFLSVSEDPPPPLSCPIVRLFGLAFRLSTMQSVRQ